MLGKLGLRNRKKYLSATFFESGVTLSDWTGLLLSSLYISPRGRIIVKSPLTCDPVSRIAILKGRHSRAWRLIRRMIVNLNVCLFEPIQPI